MKKVDKTFYKVRTLVLTERNTILLCHSLGNYYLPGGTREANEDPDKAVKRELTEELGLSDCSPVFLKHFSFLHEGYPDANLGIINRLNDVYLYKVNIETKDLGTPELTDYEKKCKFHIEEISLDKVKEHIKNYEGNGRSKFCNHEILTALEFLNLD